MLSQDQGGSSFSPRFYGMKTLQLTGRLAKEFGPEFRLDISSPAEGIRALCHQIPDFEPELRKGSYRVTILYDDAEDMDIDADALGINLGRASGFRVEPVIAGAKKSGLGKIILGGLLIFSAFSFAPVVGGAANLSAGIGGSTIFTYSNLANVGLMMALRGASSILTPTVETPDTVEDEDSFIIDATGNLVEQGHAIPLVYGECFTGSVLVSSGISPEDIEITTEVAAETTPELIPDTHADDV
jgi:predicted phage tail protein